MHYIINPVTGLPYPKNNKCGTIDEYNYFKVMFTFVPHKLKKNCHKKIIENLGEKVYFTSPEQYEQLTGRKVTYEIKQIWKNRTNNE